MVSIITGWLWRLCAVTLLSTLQRIVLNIKNSFEQKTLSSMLNSPHHDKTTVKHYVGQSTRSSTNNVPYVECHMINCISCVCIYIFVAITLDEAVILIAVHFLMKNIVASCDHGGTKGGADVNVYRIRPFKRPGAQDKQEWGRLLGIGTCCVNSTKLLHFSWNTAV